MKAMLEINKIYNENCIEGNGMCLIPDKSIDMILCDLPYGITNCKWDSVIPFDLLWQQYKRIIKNKSAIILFGSEPFSSYLRMSNIKEYKYDWKWNKLNGGNPLIAKHRPLGIFEDIMVFGDGRVNYYPIMEEAKKENKRLRNKTYKQKTDLLPEFKSGNFKPSELHDENLRYPKNEIIVDSRKGELNALNRLHPTQKPIKLLEYLIKTYTNENNLILDNCIGAGTTAIAAINTNRDYIGFELDKTYFDLANERIEKHNSLKLRNENQ